MIITLPAFSIRHRMPAHPLMRAHTTKHGSRMGHMQAQNEFVWSAWRRSPLHCELQRTSLRCKYVQQFPHHLQTPITAPIHLGEGLTCAESATSAAAPTCTGCCLSRPPFSHRWRHPRSLHQQFSQQQPVSPSRPREPKRAVPPQVAPAVPLRSRPHGARGGIGRGEGTPPRQGAQPMPSPCPLDGKCQLQRHFVTDSNRPQPLLATSSNRLSNRLWGRL